MELTNREQEAFNAISGAGAKGIGFKDLKKKLNVRGTSTLRQRLGRLRELGVVKSELNGKLATYTAVAK